MSVLIALLVATAIAAPHVLRLENAHPASAALIWFEAVCLRALVALFVAVFVVFYIPATALFALVTRWCWHTVLPVLTAHVGFSGHSIGDLALLAPMLALALSLVTVSIGLWHAMHTVSTWVRRSTIGSRPDGSLLVGERDIVVGAAGLRRPRVIISAGALATFDDEELEASLAHERGHIARRHRFVLVIAAISRALARPIPGTRCAVAELTFHLERDADRWALERRHDPAALASAICKAATPPQRACGALQALGGGAVIRRVRQLLDHDGPPRRTARLDLVAGAMLVLVVGLGALAPSVTLAGITAATQGAVVQCPT